MTSESSSDTGPPVALGEANAVSRSSADASEYASRVEANVDRGNEQPPVLVEARNLRKEYRSGPERLVVFDALDLAVRRGEMVAIVGESGSGKSTLLHLLAALDRPSSGSVYFASTWLGKLTAKQAAAFRNREIGYVWQLHYLLPEFSALENAAMPLLARGEPGSAAFAKASQLLSEVGLETRAHHRSGELSGGEQQRVSLARALVGEPRLLLADEPTGNLDSRTAQTVFDLLAGLHRSHRLTSVLVTHNMDMARRCGRILRLAGGRLHEVETRGARGAEPPESPSESGSSPESNSGSNSGSNPEANPESNPGRASGHLTASTALSVESRSETA